MGLDITAYTQCRFVHGAEAWDDESCDDADHIRIYLGHPAHLPRLDGLAPGCYVSDAPAFGFRAGSYGGYNGWREALSLAALGVAPRDVCGSPGSYAGKPFVELIDFSDCEGAIGPRTSAKLAADFAATVPPPDDWGAFANFAKAFQMAAADGWVVFH